MLTPLTEAARTLRRPVNISPERLVAQEFNFQETTFYHFIILISWFDMTALRSALASSKAGQVDNVSTFLRRKVRARSRCVCTKRSINSNTRRKTCHFGNNGSLINYSLRYLIPFNNTVGVIKSLFSILCHGQCSCT